MLGPTLKRMNRPEEAETAHQASLAAAREQGNVVGQAMELNNLAGIPYQRKQHDAALGLYTRSLILQPDEKEKASVLNNMANST